MEIKSKEIAIEFTNRCSAQCVICPRDKFNQKLTDMDFNLYKKIIDDASQYNIKILNTCGYGEVLLDKLIFERFEYAKQKIPNIEIYVSSTCFHLDKSKYKKFSEYVDTLKISFYGMTKETYEKSHRGNLKFEVSKKNILGFLEYQKKITNKTYTIILLTVTDINKNDIEPFKHYWEPLVDEVMIWKPHNFAGARSYRKIDHSNQYSCGRPFNGPLIISACGKVSVCCFDFNSKLVIGDMNYQSLYEVLHSELYRNICKAHEDRNFKNLICYNCCQTNFDENVLLYASNKKRAVGIENSALINFKEGGRNNNDL